MKRLLTDTVYSFTQRERKSFFFSLTMMYEYSNDKFRNYDIQSILDKFGEVKEYSSYTLNKDTNMETIVRGIFNKSFSDFGKKRKGIWTGFISTRIPMEYNEDLRCAIIPNSWSDEVIRVNKKTNKQEKVKKKLKPNLEHIFYNSIAFDYIMQKIQMKELTFEFNKEGSVIGINKGETIIQDIIPMLIATTYVTDEENKKLKKCVERKIKKQSEFESYINFDNLHEWLCKAEHYKECDIKFYDKFYNYKEPNKKEIYTAQPDVLLTGLTNFSSLMTDKKPKKLKIDNPLGKFTDE
jgi:hypothetical protein